MRLQDIKNLNRNDFLGPLGLESKRSLTNRLLVPMGSLGIGLLVGAGLALLLAPKAGRELRQDLRAKLHCGCKDATTDDSQAAASLEAAHHQA